MFTQVFNTENAEDSDVDDDSMADYQVPKGSKKKEKKRQEREAQRQVCSVLICISYNLPLKA